MPLTTIIPSALQPRPFFDQLEGFFEVAGNFTVDFLFDESTPLGPAQVAVGPLTANVTFIVPPPHTLAVGGEKTRWQLRCLGTGLLVEAFATVYKDGNDPGRAPAPKWQNVKVVSAFTFEPVESHPWGMVDAYYITLGLERIDTFGSPIAADNAPPRNSFTNATDFGTFLDQSKTPPLNSDVAGIYIAAWGKMSDTDTKSCFDWTGNYRYVLQPNFCHAHGRGAEGMPNGYGLASANVVAVTTIPGPVAGTGIITGTDGLGTVQVTAAPVSTNVLPGTAAGTTTLQDSAGNYYEEVTRTPVSTNTVPGPAAGTEVLTNTDSDFYVQITATPVSTVTIPGSEAGTDYVTNPNGSGDYIEQVTATPVSTNYVPGTIEGTAIHTNAEGELYEVVTRTPVATSRFAGISAVTETVTNTDGDYVVVVTAIPVSTETVPGTVAGTEVLSNSDGDFCERVTATPVSTNRVPGLVPGTEVLTNSGGDFYLRVTATPVSADVVPGTAAGTEILTNPEGEFYVRVTRTPVSTYTVPGTAEGNEILTNPEGEFYDTSSCLHYCDPWNSAWYGDGD